MIIPVKNRRVLLRGMLGAAAAALLPRPAVVRAQEGRAGAIAISGVEQPALASFDAMMVKFVQEQQVPGAALAVTHASRLVYARGFGLADREARQAVQPASLFRIASVSKPITAVAVLQLAERSKLSLDAGVWAMLGLSPPRDERWKQVTIGQLLEHTGGWDRERSFDPMFRPALVAKTLKIWPPVEPQHVVRYMLGQPLDFDPGSRHAYSNFGYCLLGRVIERASGLGYEAYVRQEVLAPLGIRAMRLGKTAPAQRAPNEVAYYGERDRGGGEGASRARGPTPLGSWALEPMDSHGGWIASAVDLARFASAFDAPGKCPILGPDSIVAMFARPAGPAGYEDGGKPRTVYHGRGWRGRSVGTRGQFNSWHTGSLDGTSALLVRRHDGRNWAVLFNARSAPDGQRLSDKIDRLIHRAADEVRTWPDVDRFPQLL
jgi:N-acyl-D-amino-acid deacylase